jgi:hypothetical protein
VRQPTSTVTIDLKLGGASAGSVSTTPDGAQALIAFLTEAQRQIGVGP